MWDTFCLFLEEHSSAALPWDDTPSHSSVRSTHDEKNERRECSGVALLALLVIGHGRVYDDRVF
jgi:hypothetical protein